MIKRITISILVATLSLALIAVPGFAAEEQNEGMTIPSEDMILLGEDADVQNEDLTVLSEDMIVLGENAAVLSEKEYATMEEAMQRLSMGEMDSTFVLYNHLDIPKFILGTSSEGYLILDRDTWAFLERAEGVSPFYGYEDEKKCYGGIGLYFTRTEEGFYDIVKGLSLEQMPYIEAIDVLGVSEESEGQGGFSVLSVDPLAVTNQLSYTDSLARRFSFGLNGGNTNDSCTAVATGLILNYLDRTVDRNIVSSDKDAEYLVTATWDVTKYPATEKLHNFLVFNCGMKSGTIQVIDIDVPFFGIGVWGPSVSGYFNNYRNSSSAIASTGISCTSAAVNASSPARSMMNRITLNIDKGIPVMMSTTLQGFISGTNSQYGQHTMMICGYDTALTSVKVHTGWYNSNTATNRVQLAGGVYRATLVDVPLSIAVYMYYFDFKAGLHTGGDGKIRYFDSNLNKATGLQTISGKLYYFGSDGIAKTGWQTISGKSYYFNSDGSALKGWWTINSVKYFFGASGEKATQCRTVYLQSAMNKNKTIDIHGGYINAAGTQAQIWSLNKGTNQCFFVWTSNGTDWYIQNEASGMVLDIYDAKIANGQPIIQWPMHGGTNQKWRLTKYTDNTTVFRSAANTNYCIDIYDAKTADGTKLILWPFKTTSNTNQRFYAG
ncbi:MAG: RICIN domain-containing protein [Coriobacteriales bacterium]|jgi:glucan-binding repeat-containing protein|nr:RICIN domain-containing protein [Coriobacteriales bacterium]